jgi:hypothetical protein
MRYSLLKSLRVNTLLFSVCITAILVIILASNLDLFCLPNYERMFSVSNEELFLIYSVIFTIISVFLLKLSQNLGISIFKMRTILFITMLITQLLIASLLIVIYGQIKTISLYYSALFYAVIYASLISSATFLAIAGFQFLRWFLRGKNKLVMTYSLVMLVLCSNSIIGIIYLSQVSLSHHSTIKRVSCSVMISSLTNPNPEAINILTNLYDITSFFSFLLAWLVTVSMLKEYSKGKNKLVYWLIFALPIILFLPRYEIALYYLSINQIDNVLTSINLNSYIYGYQTLETLLNSNLQLGGAFFGIAFLIIAARLSGLGQQRKSLIVTGIGIMLLFASKDVSSLITHSYPPLGLISIGFMGLASYMVYIGIYSTATITSRDKKLRRDLREKVENNMMLLKSIATSQDHIDIEKNVKQLMNLSTKWQQDNEQHNMTQIEIREIVNEVISEIKNKQKRS